MKRYIDFVIDPESTTKRIWDIIILLSVLIISIIIPLRIVFGNYRQDILEYIVTFLLVIDFIVSFNTGFYDKHLYIKDKKMIATKYLKGWFCIDFLSGFPFIITIVPLINWATSNEVYPDIIIVFNVLRILRLIKIPALISQIQEKFSLNPTIVRLTTFFIGFSIVSHFISLGWLIILGTDKTVSDYMEYTLALYWAVTTVSTIGFGDITPDHNSFKQLVYTIIVQIVGVGMFSFIIGNVATLLSNLDMEKANYLKKVEEVGEFLRNKKIPSDVQTKVKNYYKYLWETRKGISATDLMTDLPQSLNTEISINLNKSIVDKVPLFKDASDVFIKEVIQHLELEIFLPGDFIVQQGEYGNKMYFISAGELDVFVDKNKVATLKDGAFFGEAALLKNQKRNASVQTKNYCDLYSLSKDNFDFLRKKFPEFNEHVIKITDERAKDSAK